MHDDGVTESALRAANEFYYRAFAARDLVAMEALWAQDGVACVHPGWPALIGRAAVIASYRDIFRNTAQEAVTAREAKIIVGDNEGRVYCVEEVGGSLLVATNWFRRIDDDWRLLHHQASPLVAQAAPSTTKPAFH